MAEIGPNTRLRVSPFYEATLKEGVAAFSPYNRMLMPTSYGHPRAEYDRLTKGVSLWDVAVERQVAIEGPDAATFTQMLCTRDLSAQKIGQGKYVACCDYRGVLVNDPVVLKLAEDRFWLSIADKDMLMWCRAIAAERGLQVDLCEPDVSPLAVQGPMAENVVAAVFGDWIRDIRFFWFEDAEIDGIPVKIQRSGYSGQGGFEIYLLDGKRGVDLWNIVREAGAPWGIGPGNPSPVERIESGLLSFGGDTDDQTNPYEVRLERYVDLHVPDEVLGIQALREIKAAGPRRHQLGVLLDEEEPQPGQLTWYDIHAQGQKVGDMTCGCFSFKLERMIGFALISTDLKPGDKIEVIRHGAPVTGTLCELPFR
ncbi:MAG: glycine cleavage system protein T [Alphaproteobacteria bacterium TMED89]|nr:glycine cleavage system protein T [Rhodospirillaceae bacterium]RPH12312.1 MAG: glycine cleavage system protein T [Alphaproteobacteria bacterium TMED89]